jgi:tetraacyldisaccharide 4'-kinase
MKQSDIDLIWYGGKSPPIWMRCLVPLYRLLAWLSGLPYRLGWRSPERLPVPVVVVGNLTAGGAGKTPLVLALIEHLRSRGLRPGVVSRGYGGSARTPQLLDDEADPAQVGDEPCLIRRRTGVPVAIGRDRVAAARLLLDGSVDVVIADDGLQNAALARDIEICVIDGERRFGNGRLLPAGPMRERPERLRRVDYVVCNGGVAAQDQIPMALQLGNAICVALPSQRRRLSDLAGHSVHGVAGIGNPGRYFAALRGQGLSVIEHAFDDHHAYLRTELDFADGLPVLMTEKDAVKCAAMDELPLWYVPVEAALPSEFLDAVAERIMHGRWSGEGSPASLPSYPG